MNGTGARIAAFVGGLAIVFGAAFGVGHAIGPWDEPVPSHDMPANHEMQVK